MKSSIIISFFAFTIMACGNIDYTSSSNEKLFAYNSEADILTESSLTSPIKTTLKLLKTGDISYQNDSVLKESSRVKGICNTLNGFISNENHTVYDWREEVSLTVRVPANQFENFIKKLEQGNSEFETKTITATDVTEEFVDIKARLKTKKVTEQRYQELLNKANSVSEILEIERQISILREEIESVEGRLNYLTDRVSSSTLNITIFKNIEASEDGFLSKCSEGISSGWNGFKLFLIGLVTLWPLLLLGVFTYYLIRFIIHKNKKH